MKILVLSCDSYSYLWPTFFALLDKYYPNHPEVYLSTERKQCKFCKTINTQSDIWTVRYKNALEHIPDDYVLVMLEDFFIRGPVDEERINQSLELMKNNKKIAVCNFELQYRKGIENAYPGYDIQKNNQIYLNSCQPSLWNKEILINRLQTPQDAWAWETTLINSPYLHLINNTNKHIIDIGYRHQAITGDGWGVTRGRLSQECQDFLKTEGLEIKKHKLSIITPYYNVLNYTKELAAALEPQLTDEVEWIIVDDGCNETELDKLNAQVIHLKENSGGASVPRNEGMKIADGDYTVFIDADDLVQPYYIKTILNKIENSTFDYCYFGWKGIGALPVNIMITDQPPEWNTSIWNCIYKTENIKNIQFDPALCMAEDYEFNKLARIGKCEHINKIIYIYRAGVENGLTKRGTKYNPKYNKQYDYSNVFYFYKLSEIGGVETFIYQLAKKYQNLDITVFYKEADSQQLARLSRYVSVKQYTGQKITCKKAFFHYDRSAIDTIQADEYYGMIHADYLNFRAAPPPTHPKIKTYIGVTQAVCDAFKKRTGKPCVCCYNPLVIGNPPKVLRLLSATRFTYEKGAQRIEQLATALEQAGIPYEWTIFSDTVFPAKKHNIIFRKPRMEIYDDLRRADYVVQLSDTESFCYTMVEALSVGTPVIVCPWPCLKELGVNETNSFILPFNMKNIPAKEIYEKKFNFKYSVPEDVWNTFLAQDESTYAQERSRLYLVEALDTYEEMKLKDGVLGYLPKRGTRWTVNKDRLDYLLGQNPRHVAFVRIVPDDESK